MKTEGSYVWCYQKFDKSVVFPALVRITKETPGGRCEVELMGGRVYVNRGACSSQMFDPYEDSRFQENPALRKPRFVDPVFGAKPLTDPPKTAKREN